MKNRNTHWLTVVVCNCGRISALLIVLLSALPASADSLLVGQVRDAVAGTGVPGVKLELRGGDRLLGESRSDAGGGFSVPVPDVGGGVRNLSLLVIHADYLEAARTVQLRDGTPTEPSYTLALLPGGLSMCRRVGGDNVVVGHFRSPLGESYEELPGRIVEALQFNLLTRLGALHLDPGVQPVFVPCPAARPGNVVQDGRLLAQALGSHALITGSVKPPKDAVHDVRTTVSDAYGAFARPPGALNRAVDLNDPEAAQMDDLTHAAVLIALAAGYERAGDCNAALMALKVVDQLLPDAEASVAGVAQAIRQRCRERLGLDEIVLEDRP